MKKYRITQVIIFSVITMVAGILFGMSIRVFHPYQNDQAGSIGKVERYRNIQITDADIHLRNEMIGDAVKRLLYENNLGFFYNAAIKTSSDLIFHLTEIK